MSRAGSFATRVSPLFLGALLQNTAITAGTLKLEVTEGMVAANQDVRAALERCRALGAGIAIDDFGTGASSLSQLKDISFDTIKIDQSFSRPPQERGKERRQRCRLEIHHHACPAI